MSFRLQRCHPLVCTVILKFLSSVEMAQMHLNPREILSVPDARGLRLVPKTSTSARNISGELVLLNGLYLRREAVPFRSLTLNMLGRERTIRGKHGVERTVRSHDRV